MQAALENVRLPPHWTARVFEVFAERSLREYSDLQKSDVHDNREKVFRAAISQVMEQVRPVISQPFDGDLTKAAAALMPVLAQVCYPPRLTSYVCAAHHLAPPHVCTRP